MVPPLDSNTYRYLFQSSKRYSVNKKVIYDDMPEYPYLQDFSNFK